MWWLIIALVAVSGAVLYWLLIITEGVYLGRSVVVWLYDRFAPRYDAAKAYTTDDETILVVEPVLSHLRAARPRVLDVATGTGRVPRFLCADDRFDGRVTGLDASLPMLAHARHALDDHAARVDLLAAGADRLPFPSALFDTVTCLESLEFFPSEETALREMVRVLRPGGALLVTRRRGWEARTFIGRYRSPAAFLDRLHRLGLVQTALHPWQSNYDLAVGRKPNHVLSRTGDDHRES